MPLLLLLSPWTPRAAISSRNRRAATRAGAANHPRLLVVAPLALLGLLMASGAFHVDGVDAGTKYGTISVWEEHR